MVSAPLRQHRGLEVIAFIKLIKGGLLIALACGMASLFNKNVAAHAAQFVHHLNADPHSHYFRLLLAKVLGVSPLWSIGSFFYGLLYLTEGIGLMLARRWAEYLTTI